MHRFLTTLLILVTFGGPLGAEQLRVMSYNVRWPNPNDGANYWDNRRDVAVAAIRSLAPDLIGTQELYARQGNDIVERLPAYAWFGPSRQPDREDERMGVFYKKDRLKRIDSGSFWLSETPDVPGSMSWKVNLPRLVTWGLFESKASGARFYFLNTHFPHRKQDAEARVKCAGVIVKFIRKLPAGVPVVLTGDFNDPAGQRVYEILTRELTDTRATAASRSGPEGTFHGFTGKPGEARIDWILYRAPWKVLREETVLYHEQDRYPSDHFPVFAVFEMTGDSAVR